jgi:cellulose synthase/poly-beta-1,6-N-acetylglucosamine synthase-like glycosyltransferase
LLVLRVASSRSKANNVNAALQVVHGEFTAVFDADHQPAKDAFRRAWHWISHGADIVQGHCAIRNGAESAVARTVAVEFESIYAVSHIGRARLHGFGLFGGSNGFWRTDVLRGIRMRGAMLTEDIDSSMRALRRGFQVVHDRTLLSRELAPETLSGLWNQRARWAQGWFQVSRRHLSSALRSQSLSRRNKIGLCYLLGWREIYPWISLQMFPTLAYLIMTRGWGQIDLLIPIFVLTSLYTLSAGPSQVLFTWMLAEPEMRKRPRWFLRYFFVSFFYTEFKNVIARAAQVKELTGHREWVVTPRQSAGAVTPLPERQEAA